MKPRRRTRRHGAVLLALAVVSLSAPAAWALGELSQKLGTAGCVSETGTGGACQDGTALEDAVGVAPSPDGKNLYVASLGSGAVAVFDCDSHSGALTPEAVASQGPGKLART